MLSNASAQPIEIPALRQKTSLDGENILLGYGDITRAGWGGYSPNKREYLRELLPCFFEKTLVLLNRSTIPQKLKLSWTDVSFDTMETIDPYNQNTIHSINMAAVADSSNIIINPGAILTHTNVPLNNEP
jgi:hypothetical protein